MSDLEGSMQGDQPALPVAQAWLGGFRTRQMPSKSCPGFNQYYISVDAFLALKGDDGMGMGNSLCRDHAWVISEEDFFSFELPFSQQKGHRHCRAAPAVSVPGLTPWG